MLLRKLRTLYRLTLGYPLRSVPELKGRVGLVEGFRSGSQALWYRTVAENLVFAVQYATFSEVEGDIAEFGCMTGRTAAAIAGAMQLSQSTKAIHLFDSFEGLPEAESEIDRDNVHVREGIWGKGTCHGITPAQLRKKCRQWLPADRINVYEGWFSATLPTLPDHVRFSMVHVDCDLYQSALDVLDYLFRTKRLSTGAIVLFDDWNCNFASPDHGERRAWSDVVERYNVRATDLGSYGWAGQKMIVHSYS